MNNYEYIIGSLPVLHKDGQQDRGVLDPAAIIADIREQLSAYDNGLADMLMTGDDPERLNHDFYVMALSHKNRFIREYFRYDLNVRNAKVEYLNRSLGRMVDVDMIVIGDDSDEQFDDRAEVDAILGSGDILRREKGLDDIMWRKIDEITVMDVFDIEYILGFIAKLGIVGRWLRLDPESGKVMFHKLVDDIRSTYDNAKTNKEII